MSTNYSKVKKYYKTGLWDISRVSNAVVKGWITEDEYEEITGEEYAEEE
ncbi:MAG: XkdX family protein [Clostridiales bacterium]|nr:XkdX family protein [Clostridiales bacterium]